MSKSDDHSYFTRRFAEEMERGDQAESASIAAIHYELAHRYSLIVRASPPTASLTLVGGSQQPSHAHLFFESEDQREYASG